MKISYMIEAFFKKNVVALGAVSILLMSCTKTKFGGKTVAPQPQPKPLATSADKEVVVPPKEISPNETDASRKFVCADNYKAVRVAFIVDNSGSHASSSDSKYGTDPDVDGKTQRQRAVNDIILYIAESDKTAISKNPDFLGSEVGVATFAKNIFEDALENWAPTSGPGFALPKPMTNLKDVIVDENFKKALAQDLYAATKDPKGNTPYATGLTAAKHLLKDQKSPTELRSDLIFFITDGFPTDSRPSEVAKLKTDFSDTEIYVFSVYKDGDQNKLKDSVKLSAWDKVGWGKAEFGGSTATSVDFDRYWAKLLQIPDELAAPGTRIQIDEYSNLKDKMAEILKNTQTCK